MGIVKSHPALSVQEHHVECKYTPIEHPRLNTPQTKPNESGVPISLRWLSLYRRGFLLGLVRESHALSRQAFLQAWGCLFAF
ncbi:hypothetical protein NDI37_08240 [Funiculus sociatus GB2-A5]|uniref:Uncharacterized protein n=1 Tax=Funiculus sociatus GB2-A5 TaxID=2933946 RepID=A0ABV0JLZ7_9CYAN|nr:MULTISPECIES: hypothetical protein [unclassified Trichocoleus]MBD1907226.1 hypothetical protein [Trichocoleus sp. FACHB-832]MBD2064269.1 hypothetical protein [Trichocoleus sp. FACHB-6]